MSSDERVPKPDCVNYKPVGMHNGRYRLRKVPLNNITGSSVTLSATATTLVEWKIPARTVFNPARSFIDYQTLFAAAGIGNYTWAFDDTFEICGSIQFCNASGIYLTDLQYASNYVSAARKIDTETRDYLSLDFTNALHKHEDVPTTNYFPPKATAPGASNVYGASNAVQGAALTLLEPRYARISAANAVMTVGKSVPLAAFTHTALGMDKDMIFGEDIYIRMQIAPSNKVGWVGTSATDPAAGAVVLATQPIVSQLYLQLAVQTDEVLRSSVEAKFLAGGMSFLIPYVYGWRNSTLSGVASIQIQLNNQYGKRLKRLLHIPFGSSETLNLSYDHQNMNGGKITKYQTFLDSQPLQDAQLSCLQPVAGGERGMDDWRENRELVRDSALFSSAPYYYNWFHIDSFSQPKSGKVMVPEENILEGLDLSMPRAWTITATTAVDLTHYTFGEFVREVQATPMGTQIMVA